MALITKTRIHLAVVIIILGAIFLPRLLTSPPMWVIILLIIAAIALLIAAHALDEANQWPRIPLDDVVKCTPLSRQK